MKKHGSVCAIILAGLMLGAVLRVSSGCAASEDATTVQQSGSAANPLAELQIPESVSPALWELLNAELQHQLELQPPRSTATAPQSLQSQSKLTLSNETQLDWDYRSQGDYDQNGEVNVADLVPLAIHFHESALPDTFPPESLQSVVDGDNNGEINLADVQPIAVNFHNTVNYYRLYRSPNPDNYPGNDPDNGNGAAQLWQEIPFHSSIGNPAAGRLRYEFELPEQREGDYLWVRPVHSTDGIASTLAGPVPPPLFSISGRVVNKYYGTPVPRIVVELSGDESITVETGMDGLFVFEGLRTGGYEVDLSRGGWEIDLPHFEFAPFEGDEDLGDIPAGQVNMFMSWGTSQDDFFRDVHQGPGGEYTTVGYKQNSGYQDDNDHELLIHKSDPNGETLWATAIDIDYQLFYYFQEGSVFSLGEMTMLAFPLYRSDNEFSWPEGYSAVILIDNQGDVVACKVFSKLAGIDRLELGDIAGTDQESNVYLAGQYDGSENGRAMIVSLAPDGAVRWARTYASPLGKELVYSATVDNTGIYCAGIVSMNDLHEPRKGLVFKTSLNGDLLWSKSWEYLHYNRVSSLLITGDGRLVAVGSASTEDSEIRNGIIHVYDSFGNLLLQKLVTSASYLGFVSEDAEGNLWLPHMEYYRLRLLQLSPTLSVLGKWQWFGYPSEEQISDPYNEQIVSHPTSVSDMSFSQDHPLILMAGSTYYYQGVWSAGPGTVEPVSVQPHNWPMQVEEIELELEDLPYTQQDVEGVTNGNPGQHNGMLFWVKPSVAFADL